MRDEMDARIWAAHHDHFAALIERGARALAREFGRIEPGRGVTGRLLAALLATSLTLVTFGTTIA